MTKHWLLLPMVFALWANTMAAGFTVDKSADPEIHETSYTAHSDTCAIEWVVKRFPASSGMGISERSSCKLSLAQQSPYRAELLQKIMADTNNLQGMRNFYWGRLLRGDRNDEYSVRLSQAIASSAHWNTHSGTLVRFKGGLNEFVMVMLNQNQVFAEVIAVFAQQGFLIEVHGIEKVLVGAMPPQGDKASVTGKVPFDCVVSFTVTPKKPAKAPAK